MGKVIWSLFFLALVVVSDIASAVPLRMVAQNQRSSSGTRSSLIWLACATPNGPGGTFRAPCINPTNPWVVANGVVGSTATWNWDPVARILSATGQYWATSYISSQPGGSPVISDRVVDLVIDLSNATTSAASYTCVEGTFLAGVGANGCGNFSLGFNAAIDSTLAYNIGGDPTCVLRTMAGDDAVTGNARGVTNTAGRGPACNDTNGGFTLWTLLQDNLSTGGTLIVSNGVCIGAPGTGTEPQVYAPCAGANWMTFSPLNAADDAVDDPLDPSGTPHYNPIDIPVMANDVGFNDPVTVTVTSAPASGAATAVVSGSPGPQAGILITYTYTGAVGAIDSDSFVYSVMDADGFTHDSGTVTVNLSNNDFITIRPTNPATSATIPIGANDIGLGITDPVTVTIVSPPDNPDHAGTVQLLGSGGSATAVTASYTPAWVPGTPTYVDHFTYRITGANSVTDDAVVTVTVSNNVPQATDETVSISTKGEAPILIDAGARSASLGISSSSLGDGPSTVTCEGAVNCTNVVTASGRGAVAFDPVTNQFTYAIFDPTFFVGTDVVNYTITDADGEQSSGTLTVTLPEARAGQVDDNDPGDDVFDDTSFFSHLILVRGRSLPQVLDDSAEDLAGGIVLCNPAIVDANDPDPLNPAHAYCPLTIRTTENTKSSNWTVPIVLGNGDLTQHTTAIVPDAGSELHGTCEIAGLSVRYTPESGFIGNDRCTVIVTDGDGDTDTGFVYVNVAAGGGGGGGGGAGLSSGGGSLDILSLSLLAAASGLRRRPRLWRRA